MIVQGILFLGKALGIDQGRRCPWKDLDDWKGELVTGMFKVQRTKGDHPCSPPGHIRWTKESLFLGDFGWSTKEFLFLGNFGLIDGMNLTQGRRYLARPGITNHTPPRGKSASPRNFYSYWFWVVGGKKYDFGQRENQCQGWGPMFTPPPICWQGPWKEFFLSPTHSWGWARRMHLEFRKGHV